MQFIKFVALVGLLAGGALAAPTDKPQKPPKPAPPPPPPTQQNACGNSAKFSSQCGATTICCNAQNSVQICTGNAQIITPPYYPYY
ncbi:MAG: hypothetical protein Q9176_005752 [Flavoplaca citrina]